MNQNLYFRLWDISKKMNFKLLIIVASVVLSLTSLMFAQITTAIPGTGGSSQGSAAINNVLCNVVIDYITCVI